MVFASAIRWACACALRSSLVGPRQRRDAVGHPILVDQRCVLCSEAVAFSACCCHEDQEPDDSGQQTAQRARQQHPVLSLARPAMTADLERSPDRHETVTACESIRASRSPDSGDHAGSGARRWRRRGRRQGGAGRGLRGRWQWRQAVRPALAEPADGGGSEAAGCWPSAASAGAGAAQPSPSLSRPRPHRPGSAVPRAAGRSQRRAWRWRDRRLPVPPRVDVGRRSERRSRQWTGRRRRGPVRCSGGTSAGTGTGTGTAAARRRGRGGVTGGKTAGADG